MRRVLPCIERKKQARPKPSPTPNALREPNEHGAVSAEFRWCGAEGRHERCSASLGQGVDHLVLEDADAALAVSPLAVNDQQYAVSFLVATAYEPRDLLFRFGSAQSVKIDARMGCDSGKSVQHARVSAVPQPCDGVVVVGDRKANASCHERVEVGPG